MPKWVFFLISRNAKCPESGSPNIFCHFTYFKRLLLFKKFWDSGTTSQPRHLHNVFIQPQDKHQVTRPDDISLANLPSK